MTNCASFQPWEGKRGEDSGIGICFVFSEPPVAEEAAEEDLMNQEKAQECPHKPMPEEKATPNYRGSHTSLQGLRASVGQNSKSTRGGKMS